MAVTISNWHLNSYTADTWTDLVVGECTIANLTFSNVSDAAIDVEIRLVDSSDTPLVTLLPSSPVDATSVGLVSVNSINVLTDQKIQIKASADGAEFLASGVTY